MRPHAAAFKHRGDAPRSSPVRRADIGRRSAGPRTWALGHGTPRAPSGGMMDTKTVGLAGALVLALVGASGCKAKGIPNEWVGRYKRTALFGLVADQYV